MHIRLKHMKTIEWIPVPGLCRKHKPGSICIDKICVGVQPIMDANGFCGEFREEK
jgi:hypothetical protein